MSCLIGIADSIVASEQEITWDTNKIGGQVVKYRTLIYTCKIASVLVHFRFRKPSEFRSFFSFARNVFVSIVFHEKALIS